MHHLNAPGKTPPRRAARETGIKSVRGIVRGIVRRKRPPLAPFPITTDLTLPSWPAEKVAGKVTGLQTKKATAIPAGNGGTF